MKLGVLTNLYAKMPFEEALKKFADMGLVPGAVLTLEGRAPLGDLLRIRLLDSVISLRGSDGAFILLKNIQ